MFCLHLLPHPKSWLAGNQQSTQQFVIKEAHKHSPALHSGYQQTQQFSPGARDCGRYEELLQTESRNVDGKIKLVESQWGAGIISQT